MIEPNKLEPQRKIVTIPDKSLRQRCEKVDKITSEIISFAKELADFLEVHTDDNPIPVGISAPQLGIAFRIFAFRVNPSFKSSDNIQVLINPELVYAKGLHLVKEGCLSIPDKMFTLRRHKLVKIRGLTLEGNIRSFRGRDLLAQVFEHELNHLDGILLDDIGNQVEY